MKRKLFPVLATGFGCTVLVMLVIQFCMAQAGKSVVAPAFAARFTNEAAAMLAQLGLCGLIGVAFAGGAQVFEIESWSFLKQGIVHFLITAVVWIPVLIICWTPLPKGAIWGTVGGWFATYGITWGIQYLLWRAKVRQINRSIRAYRKEG